MPATDPVQAVAEALLEHVRTTEPGCLCGWKRGPGGNWRRMWCDHLAEVAVEAARPLIAAEALREAAGVWMQGHWADDLPTQGASRPQLILGMAQRASDWLRARADDLEAGP